MDAVSIERFIDGQLAAWPQAASGYDALKSVEMRRIDMSGMQLRVQFNPARIVSTAAKVDDASVRARRCFLCAANRPEQQESILWGGHYNILVNPFPIFPRHLTIADVGHTPQRIAGRAGDMIRLAADLPGFVVFYNGPKCGASAPDHMHFQAGNSDFLTIGDAVEAVGRRIVLRDGRASLSLASGLPLNVFVIDAPDSLSGSQLFGRLCAALPMNEGEPEPMMNVLCQAMGADGTRMLVIPRRRHRPSFYGSGSGQMLVSPASVDLGGVFITPRPDDFRSFDADTARRIFDELCLSDAEIETVINRLK